GVNIILTPSAPFDFNEKVTVQVEDGIQTISGGHLKGLSFSFNTRRENSALEVAEMNRLSEENDPDANRQINQQNQKTAQDSVPEFAMFIDESKAFNGLTFYGTKHNVQSIITNFIAVVNGDGSYSFIRDVGTGNGTDFKINKNGYLSYFSFFHKGTFMLDSNYNIIDSFKAKNGYESEID